MTEQITESFEKVFLAEARAINTRRPGSHPIELEQEVDSANRVQMGSDGRAHLRPTEKSQVVGLALSGGGIRSAAFCLGALQGLHKAKVLDKVDYLSTVSGGGYIGCSLTACMTSNGGHFPFENYESEDETPSVQHIRDHSNYLFPEGPGDIWRNASIYVRGLVANAIIILPFLLVGAALTIFAKPFAFSERDAGIGAGHFFVTTWLGIVVVIAIIAWGIARSRHRRMDKEIPSWMMNGVVMLIALLCLVAFAELQPYVLNVMFEAGYDRPSELVIGWIISILTPVAAVFSFMAKQIGEFIKSSGEKEGISGQIVGYALKVAVYVAGLIVPALLWLVYLQLSYWGICFDAACHYYDAPVWLSEAAAWLVGVVAQLCGWVLKCSIEVFQGMHAIAWLYLLAALPCVLLTRHLRPNANSLHPLYRDRLGKAFLFEPQKIVARTANGQQPQLNALNRPVSWLSPRLAPYHLINTALNIQGSAVNRRGRNADFFMFSPLYVGSSATGYVCTKRMEDVASQLDLATAMAVSGAAASSNMGSASIKPLTASLALLNIRLGYWLRNPRRSADKAKWNRAANYYFILEMFGSLDESRKSVYLTDGGHIENLGIYELLRRRCKVIIAVDAEADSQMAFSSFNVLERYAEIDLGVRIELPWQQISDVTKKTGEAIDTKGDTSKLHGPHVAIGQITYPGDVKGVLIYIKASMTGDENDCIFHYKKRYGAFPHETTADQLFSEEQFEAYRALGFHATDRFFDRRDGFAFEPPAKNPCVADHIALLDTLFPLPGGGDPCAPRSRSTFAAYVEEQAQQAPPSRRDRTRPWWRPKSRLYRRHGLKRR